MRSIVQHTTLWKIDLAPHFINLALHADIMHLAFLHATIHQNPHLARLFLRPDESFTWLAATLGNHSAKICAICVWSVCWWEVANMTSVSRPVFYPHRRQLVSPSPMQGMYRWTIKRCLCSREWPAGKCNFCTRGLTCRVSTGGKPWWSGFCVHQYWRSEHLFPHCKEACWIKFGQSINVQSMHNQASPTPKLNLFNRRKSHWHIWLHGQLSMRTDTYKLLAARLVSQHVSAVELRCLQPTFRGKREIFLSSGKAAAMVYSVFCQPWHFNKRPLVDGSNMDGPAFCQLLHVKTSPV